MVLSGAERTAKSRKKKAIDSFITEYLGGKEMVTIKEFIKAKEDQFTSKHMVGSVSFDHGFINRFHDNVDMGISCEDGFFKSADLIAIWNGMIQKKS